MEPEIKPGVKKPRSKTLRLVSALLALSALLGGSTLYFLRRGHARSAAQVQDEVSVLHLEVCNMIAGNFKAKLAGMGNHCMLSVPTIITGGDYHMHSLADGGTIEVALEFETSLLWITLELHS